MFGFFFELFWCCCYICLGLFCSVLGSGGMLSSIDRFFLCVWYCVGFVDLGYVMVWDGGVMRFCFV